MVAKVHSRWLTLQTILARKVLWAVVKTTTARESLVDVLQAEVARACKGTARKARYQTVSLSAARQILFPSNWNRMDVPIVSTSCRVATLLVIQRFKIARTRSRCNSMLKARKTRWWCSSRVATMGARRATRRKSWWLRSKTWTCRTAARRKELDNIIRNSSRSVCRVQNVTKQWLSLWTKKLWFTSRFNSNMDSSWRAIKRAMQEWVRTSCCQWIKTIPSNRRTRQCLWATHNNSKSEVRLKLRLCRICKEPVFRTARKCTKFIWTTSSSPLSTLPRIYPPKKYLISRLSSTTRQRLRLRQHQLQSTAIKFCFSLSSCQNFHRRAHQRQVQ